MLLQTHAAGGMKLGQQTELPGGPGQCRLVRATHPALEGMLSVGVQVPVALTHAPYSREKWECLTSLLEGSGSNVVSWQHGSAAEQNSRLQFVVFQLNLALRGTGEGEIRNQHPPKSGTEFPDLPRFSAPVCWILGALLTIHSS